MANKSKRTDLRIRSHAETVLLRDIQGKFSTDRVRLFRNNTGTAWMGPYLFDGSGAVIITRPTRVAFGLVAGSSDLIGWRTRIITQDMVGKKVAQFVAVEVKSPNGKPSDSQKNFLAAAKAAGALCGVAKSEDDVVAILAGSSGDTQ